MTEKKATRKNKKEIFKAMIPLLIILGIALSVFLFHMVKENQKPLARVNGVYIYNENLTQLKKILSLSVGELSDEMVLELLIEEELLLQEAKEKGITITESNKAEYFKLLNSSFESYDDMISIVSDSLKLSKEATQQHIENQIIINALLEEEQGAFLTLKEVQKNLVDELKENANIKRYKAYALGEYETFKNTGKPVCTYNGKPIIRFYSSSTCPHCNWVEDPLYQALKPYIDNELIILQHWDVNSQDNLLTLERETKIPARDQEGYKEYAEGRVPFFDFGCTYVRIGNVYETESNGYNKEIEAFKAITEKLLE